MDFYGLIGKSTGKSYSKDAYKFLAGIEYNLLSFPTEETVLSFLQECDFKGMNITIPYKKLVKEQCTALSPEAIKTNAVNVIVKNEETLSGFNTDVYGFAYLLDKEGVKIKNKKCLILGTGSTSRTVEYVLNKRGALSIDFMSTSKKGDNIHPYSDTAILENTEIIINTSPVGMIPNEDDPNLIDFTLCKSLECFVDVVYKPTQTNQVISAQNIGARGVGGLRMFIGQAVKSAEIYFNKEYEPKIYDQLFEKILLENANIVLIGHSFSGKTTIGQELAKQLNLKFIDVDNEIVKERGKSISQIFKDDGEEYFRIVESKKIAELSESVVGCVISLGGGAVLDEENMNLIRRNSVVLNIERDIKLLNENEIKDRPLCTCKADIQKLIDERKPLYKKYSNYTIKNNKDINEAVDTIRRIL